MKRYFMIVSGIVQQVGFRYFVQQTASELNLTGWVRNCYDDTVELEVQGDEETIVRFVKLLRKGNGFSRIDDITPKIIDIKKDERSFKVMY